MYNEKKTLVNGNTIPALALGTWQTPNEVAGQAVRDAVSVGYRHIDTAIVYENEAGIGEGIRSCGVAREELFLTSKIPAEVKTFEGAEKAIDDSLRTLGVSYLDLMLIHAPRPWEEMFVPEHADYYAENLAVWRALEKAYEEKKVRAIGVSNFEIPDLQNLLDHAKIKPQVNQIRLHIGHDMFRLMDFCAQNDILVEGYSPNATGKLFGHPAVQKMADKYGVSVSQLCIKYDLQLGTVVLAKTTHKEYMIANGNLDFMISDADMDILKNVEEIPYP